MSCLFMVYIHGIEAKCLPDADPCFDSQIEKPPIIVLIAVIDSIPCRGIENFREVDEKPCINVMLLQHEIIMIIETHEIIVEIEGRFKGAFIRDMRVIGYFTQ